MSVASRISLSSAWLCASVTTTLANKQLASSVAGPLVLTLVQFVVAGVVSVLLVFACTQQSTLQFFDQWSVVWIFTMSPLFLISIAANLVALEKVTITTWLVIRNIEPVIVAVLESLVPSLRRDWNALSFGSMVGLVCGSLMAQRWSSAVTLKSGVVWCVASIIVGACARVWQAWLFDHTMVQRHILVMFNNSVGSLFLFLYLVLFDRSKLGALLAPECPREWILLSCVPATFLSFANVILQGSFSASQMAFLSCVAKILLIIISVYTLNETLGMTRTLGIVLSIASCLIYTIHCPPKTLQATPYTVEQAKDEEPLVLRHTTHTAA